MTEPTMPSVALIVPIRNEHRHIDECLASLVAQTYPSDRLRIIVVDGESDDGTPDRVRAWMERDGRVSLLLNPERVMPVGLNRGIAATDADVVGVISGHSSVQPDYVVRGVQALVATGAWCVGSRVERISTSPVQRAIARAATSPVGVGDSRHNYATEPGWAETAFPGIWWRWVFDRTGPFDVTMPYNEDNELAHRILAAGGGIWFEPSIVVRYIPRGTLDAVFTQYRRYGRGKMAVFRKHPAALRWRHLVPPAWVAWLPLSLGLGVSSPRARWAMLASVAAYAALIASASVRRRQPGDPVLLTMAAFAAIHAGYGIGVWQGVLDLIRRR